ncbi:hypothetical protein PIB30_058543 [Stylosanthes scabra]|uniref:Uncharacterized protein n=1 Tax=Stylosanthes scabra TaxID=79078 RepID=A0ABU6SKT0_9FABA|nr:hypothetical protein [Stylosanthes scabra]
MEFLRLRVNGNPSVTHSVSWEKKEQQEMEGPDELECVFDGFGPACRVNDPMVGERDDVDQRLGSNG